MKICVALAEATTAAFAARMADLAARADLFEVRADHASDLDLAALLRARTKPILFTCRAQSEGGRFPDRDAAARRRLLLEAAERGFDFVDVEARAGLRRRGGGAQGARARAVVARHRGHARRPRCRLRAHGRGRARRREDRRHRALDPRPGPRAGARRAPRRGRAAAAGRARHGAARRRLARARRALRRAVRFRLRGRRARDGCRPAHGRDPGRRLSRALDRPRHAGVRPPRQRRAAQSLARDPEPCLRRVRDRRGLRPAAGRVARRVRRGAARARLVGLERDAPLQGRDAGPPRLRDAARRRGRLSEHGGGSGRAARRPQHRRRRRAGAAAPAARPAGPARRDPRRGRGRARRGVRAREGRGPRRRARAPGRAGARGRVGDRRARPRRWTRSTTFRTTCC